MKFKKTIFIAEVGVNHNGSIKILSDLIKKISKTKVDFLKFQAFKAESIATRNAPKANYQKKIKQSQFEMLRKYELNLRLLNQIHKMCKKNKVKPLFSIFDSESLASLKKYRYEYFKIPSGEITNYPLLKEIGKLDKKIFLSTGMSSLKEIKNAVKILINSGTKNKNLFILHCHSDYPSRFEDLNLIRIKRLQSCFDNSIGYSDHSIGCEASIAAVALGAKVIEKHVTLKTNMIGPDHSSSLPISDLPNLIKSIRNIEKSIGTSDFKRSKIENKNKLIVRKSLVAKLDIKKGDKFTDINLTCKRPGSGISSASWNKVLNKRAKTNFNKDDLIKL
tara:strand:+ start:110 stop:1111 length:1002 start_codon:yes stop_codon:yes gene_type:complete